MRYEPHGYQEYASQFILKNEQSALLLDMGLGKTVVTLTAIKTLLDKGEVKKVLVIGPLRVARDTWPDEIDKWEHLKGLKFSVAVGPTAKRIEAVNDRAAQVVIINRENVDWLVRCCKWDYDMVVIDELSSFKNHKSKRFRALMHQRPLVKRIVGLTGTPASNSLMDLWAEYKLLDMGKRLGRFIGNYREEFFMPDKRNAFVVFSYKPKDGAEEAIYGKISDITISMKGKDYLKLPELVETETKVKMTTREQRLYDEMKDELVVEIGDKEIDAVSAAALSNKLLQMANGAVYDRDRIVARIHDQKLDALEDLIESACGRNVMVCYWFKHDRDRIRNRLDARDIKSSQDIKDWNAGKIPIALIHPASAGHGLNLQQGGSIMVWFGLTWSLDLYQQCCARLYRQGQQNTVVIQHIITEGTIDERVMAALRSKTVMQDSLIEAVKAEVGRHG